MLGKTEWRLVLIVLFTGITPLVMASLLGVALFQRRSASFLNPEVEQQLNRGALVYKSYIRVVRDDMKHQGDAIAGDELLRDAAKKKDAQAMDARLGELFPSYPELVSLEVDDAEGAPLASHDRGHPVDDTKEKKLSVKRPLTLAGDDGPSVVALFAFDKHYEEELDQATEAIKNYRDLEKLTPELTASVLKAFVALVGITAVITIVLGFFLARGITKRINRLSNAINEVAAGDLHVRVPVTGSDELTELARVFNRMLSEMQASRARIEYLQRIGAWQEMAQRLAHEIKNPLTPIQLAVQECHKKYPGDDPKFRALLDTTLEIVEEEVGTLRRLVGNFSSFARLPQAELGESDLRDFLRECKEQLAHLEDAASGDDAEPLGTQSAQVTWEVPDASLPAAFDKQMLRRVVANLVRNAAQAIRDAKKEGTGHIVVSASRDGDGAVIQVEDDGPGVSEDMRERIFDPYFTTKADGTGLGLAIVKKIVVEHGGEIEVGSSKALGGAEFVIRLPGPHSLAIAAARDRGAALLPAARLSSRTLG
jgi:nitrogen fixation/metabolism regulation signal transduction histidine kinase